MSENTFLIVGGGAGGLELACKLGRRLGAQRVTLVDSKLYHIWKPSLHEVAAGTLDIHQEGLSYQMLAHDNHFTFVYGSMTALNANHKTIHVDAITDNGEEVIPARTLSYEHLVIAVGSTSNYFGVEGAAEHTVSLNGPQDAERFRLKMLRLLALADLQKATNPEAGIDIVIIGGGATGVELSAELREASSVHADYGFRHIQAHRDVRITLLEGASRILAPLPENVSDAAVRLLEQRHVSVVTDCKVTRIASRFVQVSTGQQYPADLCVWAAGIRPAAWLSELGLPVTPNGQLKVNGQLLVEGAQDIYAIGDCAYCLQANGQAVPPRAQSAHQQADYLYKRFLAINSAQPPASQAYVYKDHGSLVSLGRQTSVGSLMGTLFKSSSWFVEGLFARMMYLSLHLLHHNAVLGPVKTALLAMARFLVKRATPLVKLH